MCATGVYWEEARHAVKHSIIHRMNPHNKIIWFKMSLVQRMRNPDSKGGKRSLKTTVGKETKVTEAKRR